MPQSIKCEEATMVIARPQSHVLDTFWTPTANLHRQRLLPRGFLILMHQGRWPKLHDQKVANLLSSVFDLVHLDHWVSISKEPLCFKLLCGADLLESFAVPGLWNTEDLTTIVS